MKNKDTKLNGTDMLLNLNEITIHNLDSFWSSGCSGKASFNINCQTKRGYCEDPHFSGMIKILETKKCRERGTYLLKVKFKKEKDE